MGNSNIHFTETYNVFRLFIGYRTIRDGSNDLKLYSVKKKFINHAKPLEFIPNFRNFVSHNGQLISNLPPLVFIIHFI